MSILRLLPVVVLRAALMTLLYVVYMVLLDRSESTDALGAGLLFFLIVVVVTLVWAAVDGARRGFLMAVGFWLVASALIGVAVEVLGAVMDSTSTVALGDLIFFALLWFVPAVLGAGVGGLLRRRRTPTHA